jgi:hypothetical protein
MLVAAARWVMRFELKDLVAGVLAIFLAWVGMYSNREWKSVLYFSAAIVLVLGFLVSRGFFSIQDRNKILIAVFAAGLVLSVAFRLAKPPETSETISRPPEESTFRESAPTLKLEEPTFRETVENVTFSLGEGGVHVTYKLSDLEKSPSEPFDFGGSRPVRVYVQKGKLYADVTMYGGAAGASVEIKHNNFVVRPPNWDRNSNLTALEIVNEKQLPVFQFIYTTPSHIVVNGIFPFPGGLILANESGMVVNPILPATFALNRIFRYPSWKYPGQYK